MDIAADWQRQFDDIISILPSDLLPNYVPGEASILDTEQEKLTYMFNRLDQTKVVGYHILFALGFYQDKCWIDHDDHEDREDLALHSSPAFWRKQDYPSKDCKALVICGGGDGALQDFITCATGETIHDLA